MNISESRGVLEKVLNLIENPKIQDFTLRALDDVDEQFFSVPSSSSGKYHPNENNVEGGLVIHTLKVALASYDIANHLCPKYKDEIISAAILHDSHKGMVNGNWEGYSKEHALLAFKWLERFELPNNSKKVIRDSVRTHMSLLSYPDSEKELALNPRLPLYQRIIQMADIIGSASWCSYVPGLMIDVNRKNIHELIEDNILKAIDKVDRFKGWNIKV